MRVAAMLMYISDVHALGLETAQGLIMTESFYWNLNDRTRAFMERIKPKTPNQWPNMVQAGDYAAVLHYLKAVADMGAAEAKADGRAVVARMKAMPTDDDCFGQGTIREDGRKLHPSLSVRGEEALGEHQFVGRAQADRHDPGRRSIPADGRRRLSDGAHLRSRRRACSR